EIPQRLARQSGSVPHRYDTLAAYWGCGRATTASATAHRCSPVGSEQAWPRPRQRYLANAGYILTFEFKLPVLVCAFRDEAKTPSLLNIRRKILGFGYCNWRFGES